MVQRDDGFQLMPTDNINLFFLAGVVPREKLMSLETLLWRVCRGNIFLRQEPISLPPDDPHSGNRQLKNIVLIFFQGEQLKLKIKKIMQALVSSTCLFLRRNNNYNTTNFLRQIEIKKCIFMIIQSINIKTVT